MRNKVDFMCFSLKKGLVVSGWLLLLVCLLFATGCKRKPPASSASFAGKEKAVTPAKAAGPFKNEMAPQSMLETLFKDDPESYKEYLEIQKELQAAKYASAIQRLEKLHMSSPQAPWAETVKFQRIQVSRLSGDYSGALQACHEFIQLYPGSAMVSRVMFAEGEIYAALAKKAAVANIGDEASARYFEKALETFRLISDQYPQYREQAVYKEATTYFTMGDYEKAAELFQNLASAKPESAYGPKALYSLALIYLSRADITGAIQTYQELVDRFPEDRLAKRAQEKLKGLALVGRKAPALKIKEWIGDAPENVEAYSQKLTIISFWAIWCGHCRKNLPKMNRLADTFASQGVVVFGVSREKGKNDAEKIRSFINSNPMKFPTAVDDNGKTSVAFSVQNVPCLVVVDGHGQVCWYGHPDFLSDELISMFLQKS